MRGRPLKDICPYGHDKTLPKGSYFRTKRANGKVYRNRLCAVCERKRPRAHRKIDWVKSNKTRREKRWFRVGMSALARKVMLNEWKRYKQAREGR